MTGDQQIKWKSGLYHQKYISFRFFFFFFDPVFCSFVCILCLQTSFRGRLSRTTVISSDGDTIAQTPQEERQLNMQQQAAEVAEKAPEKKPEPAPTPRTSRRRRAVKSSDAEIRAAVAMAEMLPVPQAADVTESRADLPPPGQALTTGDETSPRQPVATQPVVILPLKKRKVSIDRCLKCKVQWYVGGIFFFFGWVNIRR